MKRLIIRLLYGMLFALPLMLVTYALAQASSQPETLRDIKQQPICPACHADFQKAWEQGAHGKAATDPAFKTAWEEKGKPTECLTCHVTGYNPATNTWSEDGITCNACHDTAAADHPKEPMAADRSSQACGSCHNETYFEWQSSAHRKAGLDCVGCHDPHNTSLKADSAGQTCATCHRERSSNFAHSQHSAQGLTCADCHLTKMVDTAVEGHARRDHSFNVRLTTCNECHAYQMHDPASVHPENPTPASPDAMASVETLSVASQPGPTNPLGFVTLAGLFGMAVGVVVAPVLQRWNKKNKHEDQ